MIPYFGEGFNFYIDRNPQNPNGVSCYMWTRDDDKHPTKRLHARLELVPMDEKEASAPSIFLSNTEVQNLVDALWFAGFRPTEGTGSAGSLRKTEEHLADMRKIAFMLLNRQIGEPGK